MSVSQGSLHEGDLPPEAPRCHSEALGGRRGCSPHSPSPGPLPTPREMPGLRCLRPSPRPTLGAPSRGKALSPPPHRQETEEAHCCRGGRGGVWGRGCTSGFLAQSPHSFPVSVRRWGLSRESCEEAAGPRPAPL